MDAQQQDAPQDRVLTDPAIGATTNAVSGDRSREDFLRTLFQLFEEHGIRYCVLHSWEGLPEQLLSDLDLAVHPRDRARLPLVFNHLVEQGYRLVQCLNYFVNAYYFVFMWSEGPAIRSVAVDLIFEHRRSGLIAPSGEDLVTNRQKQGIFWIPSPASEFVYLLAKKAWKRGAPARAANRLRVLVEQLGGAQAERLAGQIFLGGSARKVVKACVNRTVDGLLRKNGGRPWFTSLARNPLKLIGYLLTEGLRRLKRWFQPTGLFVVLLGPDGVGKGTVAKQLIEVLGPAFRRHRIFHWRAMVVPQRSREPVTDPHAHPARGALESVANALVIVINNWLAYGLMIRPFLARSGLVIFDRYFQDMMVDPLRYRYSGPMWLVRFLSRLVPPSDPIFLILDADDEVILSRKNEVGVAEIERQRASYQQLARILDRATLVKTNQPLGQTVAEASTFVIEHLAWRFRSRYSRFWLGLSKDYDTIARPHLKQDVLP